MHIIIVPLHVEWHRNKRRFYCTIGGTAHVLFVNNPSVNHGPLWLKVIGTLDDWKLEVAAKLNIFSFCWLWAVAWKIAEVCGQKIWTWCFPSRQGSSSCHILSVHVRRSWLEVMNYCISEQHDSYTNKDYTVKASKEFQTGKTPHAWHYLRKRFEKSLVQLQTLRAMKRQLQLHSSIA